MVFSYLSDGVIRLEIYSSSDPDKTLFIYIGHSIILAEFIIKIEPC